MGLQLEISLDKEIGEINAFFDDLKFKAVTLAARQGINRAASRVRGFSRKEITSIRKLKLKDLKKRITVKKAKGTNLAKLEAKVIYSGIPLPLILFILGQKTPRAQKVANPKRKSRRFEIVKGQKKGKPGLFIQKAKRGKMRFQVFRRRDPSDVTRGYRAQAIPSVAELLRRKDGLLRKIENKALAIMQTEFSRALKFQLSKLKF